METLFPLILFAFVSSITPGPNNIMLTSSGLLFGFMRTIPHLLGISVGMLVMLALCAVGVGSLIVAVPHLYLLLKVFGSAYLLYLAWRLRHMAFREEGDAAAKPWSFLNAATFQFANPKAWIISVTGASTFLPHTQPIGTSTVVFCLVFCAVNLPCTTIWTGAGAGLRRYLRQRRWRNLFCGVMIFLTVYSAIVIWL